ncbi:MAG TPA: nucleotide exchange factor GrpE [Clostridia bacterium]|nr:nucleotide exchange factor GrpE [Clostridia bacterium]
MARKKEQKKTNNNSETNIQDEEIIDEIVSEKDMENLKNKDEELSILEEKLSEVEEQCNEYLTMAQRLQAEFDNFRKRNRLAVADAYQDSKLETVEQFLPVLDNLQRALDASGDAESDQVKAIYKGMEMVIKQFIDILGKMGVEEIDALDQPFNPQLHDAVMQVEAQEGQENTVTEVLLKGYKCGEKVLRYSMVKVAN